MEGRARPRMYFSFVFFLCFFLTSSLLADLGKRRKGGPILVMSVLDKGHGLVKSPPPFGSAAFKALRADGLRGGRAHQSCTRKGTRLEGGQPGARVERVRRGDEAGTGRYPPEDRQPSGGIQYGAAQSARGKTRQGTGPRRSLTEGSRRIASKIDSIVEAANSNALQVKTRPV